MTTLREFGLADVRVYFVNDAIPATAMVSVEDGRLERLECYGRDWPPIPEIVRVNYVGGKNRDPQFGLPSV